MPSSISPILPFNSFFEFPPWQLSYFIQTYPILNTPLFGRTHPSRGQFYCSCYFPRIHSQISRGYFLSASLPVLCTPAFLFSTVEMVIALLLLFGLFSNAPISSHIILMSCPPRLLKGAGVSQGLTILSRCSLRFQVLL